MRYLDFGYNTGSQKVVVNIDEIRVIEVSKKNKSVSFKMGGEVNCVFNFPLDDEDSIVDVVTKLFPKNEIQFLMYTHKNILYLIPTKFIKNLQVKLLECEIVIVHDEKCATVFNFHDRETTECNFEILLKQFGYTHKDQYKAE